MLFNRDKNAFPFFTYASEYFLQYTSSYEDNVEVFGQIQKLFDPGKSYSFTLFLLGCLKRHARSFVSHHWENSVCSPSFGPLHAAAMLHMHKMCRWLIDQGCDANQVSPFGVPLECAIYGAENSLKSESSRAATGIFMRHLWDRATQSTIAVLLNAGAAYDSETVHDCSLSLAAAKWGPWDRSGPFAMMLEHGMPLQSSVIQMISRSSDEEKQLFLDSVDALKDDVNISSEVRIHLLNFARTNKLTTSISIPFEEHMTDRTFSEAFRHAVKFDQVSAFEKLVVDGRFLVELSRVGEDGTPLHFAAKNSSVQLLHMLLDLGCDPNVPGKLGRSVLQDVVRFGIDDERLLPRLISSKATEVVDAKGKTVWHEAAFEGNLRCLRLLFEKYGPHTPLLYQPCKSGYTPILEAILEQHSKCALLFLSETSADDTIMADKRTLYYAVAMGLEDFLVKLRDLGANLCAGSEQKQTALYCLTSHTKSDTMNLLLDCGLNPRHLDVFGRSPLVAFLALDKERDHLRPTCLEKLEDRALQKSVVEILASSHSIVTRDIDGHTAWFYFCTRMIPFILGSSMVKKGDYLTDISSILMRHEACKVYEDATGTSGVSLLVKMCLDGVHKSTKSSKTWPDIGDSRDTKAAIAAVRGLLLAIVSTTVTTLNIANDTQIIRLLAWSVVTSERLLIKKLLELGVDVHSVSEYYYEMTPVDQSIALDVEPDILDLLLQQASASRLLTVDEEGDLKLFCLCYPDPDMRTENMIIKLETLLRAGINPDVRAPNTRTMAHIAADSGNLEVLQLLVRFKADLSLADRNGWTVVHFAVADGDLDLLRFVREHLPDPRHWEATFSWKGPVSQPNHLASGPLPVKAYFGCNLLHLASFGYRSTDVLHFLKETGCFDDVDTKAHEGATPLHFAACVRSPATIQWLVINGADVDMPFSTKRRTALHYALHLGHL
jgi:ankyrin repeat protein